MLVRWGWGWGRGVDTYPALLISSSQPVDWSGLGWALLSHWGRATQSHTPNRREEGREEKGVERKGDEGGKAGSKQEKNLKGGLRD